MYIDVGGFCFQSCFFFFFRQQQKFWNHYWVGRFHSKYVVDILKGIQSCLVHYEARISNFHLVGALGGLEVGPKRFLSPLFFFVFSLSENNKFKPILSLKIHQNPHIGTF